MPPVIGLAFIQGALGVTLLLLGRWGRHNAQELAPRYLNEDERQRRVVVIRRGGMACLVAGYSVAGSVLLVLMAGLLP